MDNLPYFHFHIFTTLIHPENALNFCLHSKSVTQRFKMKYCISVSLFSNFGLFVTFLSLKLPLLITLSQELSKKLRLVKEFHRQRYAKCDDSVGSATLILHKSKQNISTLLSVSRKNVADDGGRRNFNHRLKVNFVKDSFVLT